LQYETRFNHIPATLAEIASRTLPTEVTALVSGARRFRFAAMGGSYNAACAATEYFLALGLDARPELASHLMHAGIDTVATDEVVVLISYSGTSVETIRAAEALRDRGHKRIVAITNAPESEVAALANAVVDQGLTEETHTPYGPFATTYSSLLRIAAAAAGTAAPDLSAAGPAVGRMLARAEAIRALAPVAPTYAEFFGRGAYAATAVQATLITREIARVPASAWDGSTYRHGPIEAISPEQLSVVFAAAGGRQAGLDRSFVSALRDITETVLVVGPEGADVELGVDDLVGPLVALTFPAIIAYAWGERAGIPMGQFRYTSHSITDEETLHVG
jgi:glucosamine--fructose-6-phosphate aminotransferase (isomerizing)